MLLSISVIIAVFALMPIVSHAFAQTSEEDLSLKVSPNVSLTTPVNNSRTIIVDDKGLPLVDYGGEVGMQRNPLTVAKYADYFYQKFNKTGDIKMNQAFLNNVNWLVNNTKLISTPSLDFMVLESNFPFRQNIYHLSVPWISAFTHGAALNPLYEAYALTNNKTYLDTSKMLLNSLYIPTDESGATIKFPNNGGWWYEEYPSPILNGSRVLNGMLYVVLSLHEYYTYTNDPAAKYLFDQGVVALKNELSRYDFKDGTWSFYDRYPGGLATIKYHKVHIRLLGELYDITHQEIFKDYSNKWLRSLTASNIM
jgi:hypothetical protein